MLSVTKERVTVLYVHVDQRYDVADVPADLPVSGLEFRTPLGFVVDHNAGREKHVLQKRS
jgi:hypothetical protein